MTLHWTSLTCRSSHHDNPVQALATFGETSSPSQAASVASIPITLPPSLQKSVAVLQAPNPTAPGGVTNVYVLGMSHVSQASVSQVRRVA